MATENSSSPSIRIKVLDNVCNESIEVTPREDGWCFDIPTCGTVELAFPNGDTLTIKITEWGDLTYAGQQQAEVIENGIR